MAKTLSTKDLCKGLSISKSRLDQWVARDLIKPELEAEAGPAGRQWTIFDAIRVAVFDRLLEIGVETAHARVALQFLHGFSDDDSFLVMSVGKVGRIVPSTTIGSPASQEADLTKVHLRGYFEDEIVRGRDLVSFLSNADFHGCAVVNLSNVEAMVKPLFDKAES